MQYRGKLSFIIKRRSEGTLRIARTASTLPTPTGFDELQRIVHTLARTHAAAFARHEGFAYTFGELAIGMEPPAAPHADSFPYSLGEG